MVSLPSVIATLDPEADLPVLRQAISQCNDIEERDEYGETALHCSAGPRLLSPSFTKLLLDAGANPNATFPEPDCDTLAHSLIITASNEHGCSQGSERFFGLLKLLCRYGLDLNRPDGHGTYPIHIAAQNGNPRVTGWLLLFGANSQLKDQYGRTAIERAAHFNNSCHS